MRKKIPTTEIVDKVTSSLNDVENSVSSTIKQTFTFKGRKSPEIIEKVIEALTKDGDLILDPFIGSGMTIIASQKSKRKLQGIELDNYTYNVDRVLFENVDVKLLNKYFKEIEKEVKDDIMYLYKTECCGKTNYIKKVLFDPINGKDGYFYPKKNREIVNGENIKLVNECPGCKKRTKKFEQIDWDKLVEVSQMEASNFPNDKYFVNSRINITASTGADSFDSIFTHRNKVALLKLQSAISKLPPSNEKELLQHALVASLSLARIAMYGSSTDILYHVVNEKAQDMNVWELFKTKFNNFKKFKKEFEFAQEDNFDENKNYSIILGDYLDYLNTNVDMKFDGIFTDFPYTDQVPYLERNQMFRIWLNHFDDNKENYLLSNDMLESEIVVTNAEKRKNKNLDRYYLDIDKMFKAFSEHLEPGKPVVIFTKLGKMKYFNVFAHIVDYARKNGFEYTFRTGVEKKDPTLRKQSAYKNTLINEVIIGFEKLPEDKRYFYVGDENYENKIVDDIYRKLKKVKDDPLTMTAAVLSIKRDIIKKGVRFNQDIQDVIVKTIEDNFYVDNQQYIQLDKTRLYLEQEDEATLFKKLYELVPFYVGKLLEEKGKFVLEDLYIELIDELSDGNNQTIYDLLNDDDNIREIDSLISDKTDIDGKYYVKKTLPKDFNEDAIDIATMDPYAFEDLCKNLLEQEKYSDVHRKGGSGDMGVDIVAKKFNGNESEWWLIQCKRWVSNVDATPLQRLVSERERLGANRVACYTTSGYSKDAKKVAEAQNVEIIDGEELIKNLDKHFPGKYYNSNLL